MAISKDAIPTAFREGYEKARVIDPTRADAFVRNTMVADPMADAAVASLADFDRQQQQRLIESGMNHQKEDLKAAPRELQDFFESLASPPEEVRYKPEIGLKGTRGIFADAESWGIALVAKGLVEAVTTLMGRSFLSTGYSTFEGAKRLRTSFVQVMEAMMPGGLEWYGDGWKLTVRARLAHANGRRIIHEQANNWDHAEFGVPISSAHVAFGTACFSCGVLDALAKLGAKPSAETREGYVHNWRYVGWLLGVPDEILIKDEADGVELMSIARICEPPPSVDSTIMAHTFINSAAIGKFGREDKKALETNTRFVYKVVRALIGNELADQVDFPRDSTFGVLAMLRWKGRLRSLFGLTPTRAETFVRLLEGTDMRIDDYELREDEYG